ncbi:MAG: response regulator [Bacteroidota bacterium]
MNKKSILIVDDNRLDADLIQLAIDECGMNVKSTFIEDSPDVMHYLHAIEPGSGTLPSLILLDLKMPKMDGMELLTLLKSDETSSRIPVVILSSSEQPCDIECTIKSSANAYIVKPFDYSELCNVLKQTLQFWLNVNTGSFELEQI